MRGHGPRVAAGDRAGQARVAEPQRVIQGCGQQRPEQARGLGYPGRPEQVHGLGDQRDQVVSGAGDRCVVQVPVFLGDEDRLAAHLDHQCLGRGPEHFGRGHPETGSAEPVDVVVAAGERHHRVQRQRQRALAHGRVEHGQAIPPARVGQQAALQRRSGRRQPGDQAGQHVVGDGQHGQVGAPENLAGVGDDRVGEVRVRPAQRGVRHRGRGHDLVTSAGERHAERGARSPGADDADREPGRVPGGRIGPRGPRRSGMRAAIRVHLVPVLGGYRTAGGALTRIAMTKAPGTPWGWVSARPGRLVRLVTIGRVGHPAAVLEKERGAGEQDGGDERHGRGEGILARHAGAQGAAQVDVETRRDTGDYRRRQRTGLGQRHHPRHEERRGWLQAAPSGDPGPQVQARPRLRQRGHQQRGHSGPGQRRQVLVNRPEQQPGQQRADDGDHDERRYAGGFHGTSAETPGPGRWSTMSGRRRTPRWSSPASKAATGPRPGRLRSGVDIVPRRQDERALMRARVGQGKHRVTADLCPVADDVDVERTRPEPFGSWRPDPAEFRLDALGRRQQVERAQPGRGDEHRVQVVRLRRAADRSGFVDR